MDTNVSTKRWILTLLKIWRAFRRSVPFWRNFWEPMSVNVRVALLVEDYMTLYILIEFGTLRVYKCTNEKIDSHTTKIRRAFRRSVPFWKFFFWETDVGRCEGRTLGWGQHNSIHNGYKRINEKMNSHILSNIWRAFRRLVPFRKFFREPTSVDVRVVLLVGYDKTMYTTGTNVLTKS